jgi:PAS domain S-box-containing protein
MTEKDRTALPFLDGGGEMGKLTRAYDWANSALGAPGTWPYSLRTTVSIILHAKTPMFLWWGKDHIQFYNDAYRPSLGVQGKHPLALGQMGQECWPEIWPVIYPLMEQVLSTGEPTYHEDMLVPIYRNGALEDVYWTFGYSAVMGDSGSIEGVLVVCAETTRKVLQEKESAASQQAVKESEERFRTLAEGSNILIAVNDELGRTTYMNQAWTHLTGWPVADFLAIGWANLVHPDDLEKCTSIFTEALAKKSGFSGELRVLNIHGKYAWMLASGSPRFTPDGTFMGHVSSFTDITELKDAEEAIRNSEYQIRDLVESASFPLGVFTGSDLHISLANRAMLDSWGRGRNVIGHPLHDMVPEMELSIIKELGEVYSTGLPISGQNFKVSLGEEGQRQAKYYNYNFIPLRNADGTVYGVMSTGADVTDVNLAKKQVEESEKNMRNTILKAPVAICIFRGPDYLVEIANDRMLELWGKTAEEVMHKPIFDGLPEVRNQGFEELLNGVYHEGKSLSHHDRPIVLPRDGKLSDEYISFLYEPETDPSGNVIGIIAVATIVTEQVRARQHIEQLIAEGTRELAETNRQLKRSNADLTQFAHVASHDLQEPIRKITTYLDILQSGVTDPSESTKGYFTKIGNAARRMRMLISDILTYSELSQTPNQFESVDLNAVIQNVLGDLDLLIEQKQAQINVDQLPSLNAMSQQMQQLFSNLISNSLKYAKAHPSPQINISSTREKDNWHIRVSDNGIGFLPSQAKAIFNIFQRLHRKHEYTGTGIGLAICQRIVENHHGEIFAVSEPNEGATFHILLPANTQ